MFSGLGWPTLASFLGRQPLASEYVSRLTHAVVCLCLITSLCLRGVPVGSAHRHSVSHQNLKNVDRGGSPSNHHGHGHSHGHHHHSHDDLSRDEQSDWHVHWWWFPDQEEQIQDDADGEPVVRLGLPGYVVILAGVVLLSHQQPATNVEFVGPFVSQPRFHFLALAPAPPPTPPPKLS